MMYRFGVFEFDGDSKELRKNGRPSRSSRNRRRRSRCCCRSAGEIVTPRRAARRGVGQGHARRFRSRPCLLRLADSHRARRQRRQPALCSDDSEAGIQVHRAASRPTAPTRPSQPSRASRRQFRLAFRGRHRHPRRWRRRSAWLVMPDAASTPTALEAGRHRCLGLRQRNRQRRIRSPGRRPVGSGRRASDEAGSESHRGRSATRPSCGNRATSGT